MPMLALHLMEIAARQSVQFGWSTEMSWSRIVSFSDPFCYQSAFFPSAKIELLPTAKGKFCAELTQVSMNKLWMHSAHEELPRVFVGVTGSHRAAIGFLTRPNQPTPLHCGTAVSPEDIIVTDTDLMYRKTEANCDWGAISLPKDDLDARCQILTGRGYAGPSLKHLVRPAPDLMARLLKIHEMVGQLARITPDVLSLAEVSRALEEELVRLMIRCLNEGESSRMTTGGLRHDTIIVRFAEFLEAHPDRPLYLTEICAAIGVAERTLRAACEEHLGMGPIRFLSLRRLHLVNRALRQADPLTTTVTRVATDHGFWELGRFSVAYRALFGESPSETLRRTSDVDPLHQNRPSSLGDPVLHRLQTVQSTAGLHRCMPPEAPPASGRRHKMPGRRRIGGRSRRSREC
jgi:AraC-like DNA-binding protein